LKKKYKIGLLELAHHNEVLRSYLITLLHIEDVEIHVFTNEWNREQCYDIKNSDSIFWNIQRESEKSEVFIRKNIQQLNDLNLVIQTTSSDKQDKIILAKIETTKALVIHDLHSNFGPLKHIYVKKKFPDINKDLLRVIRFFLYRRSRLKKLMASADILLLPSNIVLNYALRRYGNNYNFQSLPFTINDEISKVNSNGLVNITIPGTISPKSRDYGVVINALKTLPEESQIKLNLLGKPHKKYGLDVVNALKNLKGVRLNYYTEFIHQREFDRVMRKTDFLILPMQRIMKFGIIGEKNGYSCVSGNMNDMIRYGLPAMLPKYYPLSKEIQEMTYSYVSHFDLGREILHWVESKKYNTLKLEKVTKALDAYSKANIAAIFRYNFISKYS